jgi:GTPase
MWIDRAKIRVTAGAGGNGCCSFRREKYVPRGGPNGGDGGDGGSIYIAADDRYRSLLDLRYHSTWKGNRGEHGQGSNCHGKTGPDIVIPVPPGTIVKDGETEEILADLTEPGERFLAARGGRGGKGNARFATSTNRAPRFCELGEPGAEGHFILELKLIAEVGIVGLPNAGKSTLLAAASSARPKIGDYPFTTISPNLGVVELSDYRTLTVADIPGIIEGAAEGKGLGHDFLRHIERTKVLLFLIDLGDPDPVATRRVLERELAEHSAVFSQRPRVYALNKADLPENRARFDDLVQHLPGAFLISGATGEGIAELFEHLWQVAERVRQEEAGMISPEPEREYVYEAPFEIARTPHGFAVTGSAVVRAVRMTDFTNEEGVRHLQQRLQKMGVFKALKRMGAEEGQVIEIGGVELDYQAD